MKPVPGREKPAISDWTRQPAVSMFPQGRSIMGKTRLEAFSDGVLAIIITIMVLELKEPIGHNLAALLPLAPVFMGYVLSFVMVAIYWNNHHHLLHVVTRINVPTLWSNMHLLFWLSLVPFVTAWMSSSGFAAVPVALFGFVLLMAGVAYFILAHVLMRHHGKESDLAKLLGRDFKGIASVVLYALGIGLAFLSPMLGFGIYVLVAVIWFIPDRRFAEVRPATDKTGCAE